MTVRQGDDGSIILEGRCPIEDTEVLLSLMQRDPGAQVVWEGCEFAHTAIIQLLMAARPVLRGAPKSPFLQRWIGPRLSDPTMMSATSPIER
jgi:hypothetical protein